MDDIAVAWWGVGAPGSFGVVVAQSSLLSEFVVIVEYFLSVEI